jgi:hypothetical protein
VRRPDFGPTLAAEQLAEEDGIEIDHETLRRWMLGEDCGTASVSDNGIGNGGNASLTSGNWYSWMATTNKRGHF